MTHDELKEFHDERLAEIEESNNGDDWRNSTHTLKEVIQAFRAAMAIVEADEFEQQSVLDNQDAELKKFHSENWSQKQEITRLRAGLEEAKKMVYEDETGSTADFSCWFETCIEKLLGRGEEGT